MTTQTQILDVKVTFASFALLLKPVCYFNKASERDTVFN